MSREKLLECLDAHVLLVDSIKAVAREPESPALNEALANGLREASEHLDALAEQVTS